MTAALVVLGVALAVLAGYVSDALGLPTLARGLISGVIIGVTIWLVIRRLRRE